MVLAYVNYNGYNGIGYVLLIYNLHNMKTANIIYIYI